MIEFQKNNASLSFSEALLKGKDGVDGKTPIKGVDYWTPADKTEIVNDTLAALPTWTGGSY